MTNKKIRSICGMDFYFLYEQIYVLILTSYEINDKKSNFYNN